MAWLLLRPAVARSRTLSLPKLGPFNPRWQGVTNVTLAHSSQLSHYGLVSSDPETFGIAELAARGGVSRRTVRYYVQRGLLPRPTGVGRGNHYTGAHLARLLEVRELQERGVPLAAITAGSEEPATGASPVGAAPAGDAWFRSALTPDVELHVRGRRLSPTTLEALRRVLREHTTQEGDPT